MSSLEETVANLVSKLRRMGRKVGIEESLDATNALRILPASDPELFSAAIKATLVKDFGASSKEAGQERNQGRTENIVRFGAQDQRMGRGFPFADPLHQQASSPAQDDNSRFEFGVYSPHAISTAQASPKISRAEEKRWSIGISKFKDSILTLEGHRFKRSSLGQVDPRRTMQLELRKVGDSPTIFHSIKRISKAKVVLLADVSGSMSDSKSTIVNICCFFKRVMPKSEIFLFSTKLKRITYLASKCSPSELALWIPKVDLGFGSGTKIGHCLRQFRITHGDLLTSKTTAVIFSDGWDIGDISVLKNEMKELQRRANSVVWINPFLDSKDYSAETLGMKTALGYVDIFLSPRDLVSGSRVEDQRMKSFNKRNETAFGRS